MKINKNIWILLLFSIVTIACKKNWISVDAPNSRLVSSSVFTNSATATSAQLGIYINMANRSESNLMSLQTGLLGDELKSYGNVNNSAYYLNAMIASPTHIMVHGRVHMVISIALTP